MKMQEEEVEGTASPAKPKPRAGANADRGELKVAMPWYDFVCNRQLQTEDEARKHFAEEAHRKAVESFLAKHREQLEDKEPESANPPLHPPRPTPVARGNLAEEGQRWQRRPARQPPYYPRGAWHAQGG